MLVWAAAASAQVKPGFVVTNYTSKNGLPQNSVHDMVMDSDYLWLTTEAGLVRFDGQYFKIFNGATRTQIASDRFRWILGTQDDEKYACDIRGNFYRIEGNQLGKVNRNTAPQSRYVNVSGGLPRMDRFVELVASGLRDEARSSWVTDQLFLVPLDEHELLVKGNGNIFLYRDGRKVDTIDTHGIAVEHIFMLGRSLYLVGQAFDVYRINLAEKTLHPCTLSAGEKDAQLKNPKLRKKIFWKQGFDQPFVKAGNKLFAISSAGQQDALEASLINDSLPHNAIVTSVLYDAKRRILFVGTDTKGLFVYKERHIYTLTYDSDAEGTNNAYYAQVAIGPGTVFSSYGREASLNGMKPSSIGITDFNSESMQLDRHNRLWYASSDSIFRYDLNTRELRFIARAGANVYTFFEEGDSMWIGTVKYIGYIRNDRLVRYCVSPTVSGAKPECMIRTAGGSLWLCSCNGIFAIVPHGDSAVAQNILPHLCTRSMYKVGKYIFAGTYGKGWYVYDGRRFVKMPLDARNYLSITHGFLQDRNHFIWITTNQGIFKTALSDVEAFVKDTTTELYYSYFNDDDAVVNTEFNGGCYPNMISLRNGYFSFPSMDGLVWLDPLQVNDLPPREALHVDEVLLDQVRYLNDTHVFVPANTENVQFQLSTPYWGNRFNRHLSYMLEGFNKTWVPLTRGGFNISFFNLPAGDYVLRIRKQAGPGRNNYVTRKVRLTVEKKYYQTLWFWIVSVLLCGLALFGLIRLYIARLRKRNTLLEQRVKQRTEALAVVNKVLKVNVDKLQQSEQELQQSVNVKNQLISIISHDIVTPLRFIAMIARSSLNREEQAEIMRDIGSASEKLHQNAQNILNWIKYQGDKIEIRPVTIALNPLVEELTDLMAEMAVQRGNSFVNDISLDEVIRTDRNILTIILQNLLSNSNKYCTGAVIRVSCVQHDGRYSITVEDNGPGIHEQVLARIRRIPEKMKAVQPDSSGGGNGLGFIIITELLELLDGKLHISSSDAGTQVTITI